MRLARAAAAALLFVSHAALAAISVRDDFGREVTLAHPAQRIVTLSPFLTELAFSAGAGARVVGVSAYSDYPPAARSLPQVASSAGFSLEAIAALRPDLVLAWRDGVRPEDVERIAGFGTAVYVANGRTLEDVARALEAIGLLAGTDVRPAAADYRRSLREMRARHDGKSRVPVLLEVWHRPLTTIAGAHFMNEALETCGARNAFDDLPGVAPAVSWELVYARDPPIIVGAGSAADAAQFGANWRARGTLTAVKRNALVFLDPDTIQRPSLRLAQGVRELCEKLDRLR